MFQEEKEDDTEEVRTEKTPTDKEQEAKSDTSDEEKVKVIIVRLQRRNKEDKKRINQIKPCLLNM